MPIKPIHLMFGVGLLATAAPSLGGLRGLTQDIATARAEADRLNAEITELRLSQQEHAQKNKIAIARYQSGCLPVVSHDQRQYVSLQTDRPVIDAVTEQPLPAGTVVCDAHGNTAILKDDDRNPTTPAVAQAFAYTGDKAVIESRLKDYQGATYLMPEN